MADSQQQQQGQYQQQHEGRHWMQDQEYYAEDTFGGVHATGRVYTGAWLFVWRDFRGVSVAIV